MDAEQKASRSAGAASAGSRSASGAGRKRDPAIDARMLKAAVELFGSVGWSGFTFDEVGRRAGVGKSAIYRRWSNKEELLVAALSSHLDLVHDFDTGSLRQDLISVARQLLNSYLGDAGPAFRRLAADADSSSAIGDQYHRWRTSQTRAARTIVRRAIARGDLPEGTSVTLLMDTLCGGAVNHVLAAPPDMIDTVRERAEEFSVELVDFVLAAARAGGKSKR